MTSFSQRSRDSHNSTSASSQIGLSPPGTRTLTDDRRSVAECIHDVHQANGSRIQHARFSRLLVILRQIARLMLSDSDGENSSYRRIEKSSDLFKELSLIHI